MDLLDQTLDALDWPALRRALSERARTPMGRRRAEVHAPYPDAASARLALDEVSEILRLEEEGGWVPVAEVPDARGAFERADKGGILDKDELRQAGRALDGMQRVADTLLEAEVDIPVLRELAPDLQIDAQIAAMLRDAFDATGELSARTYPVLGSLRERISSLHQSVRRTLDDLVNGDAWADILQDRFVTQRGDRYVLPVKTNFKRKELGIVHGTSGSGQTAFIEPQEVVALNNALRLAEGELEAAEKRILTQLSRAVGRVAAPAAHGFEVIQRIDLGVCRASLSRDLEATRPEVGDRGILRLTQARHPVLVLRGLEVVANDFHLGPDQPILVISGPNTGGKTIALKTVGLCALLVSSGCFVPAAEGSRLDYLHTVAALIGDHQTVHGDHSSFSSHLAVLEEMLTRSAPGCLFLVDEIASGTDPQQGAALAHAILERLLETGPRAIITTHFHRLKTVSATNPRFHIAGMQFAEGRPTYRLIDGASGESHALETAERMGLDPELLQRARDLMGESERTLADTLAALDRERARADDALRNARALEQTLEQEREALARREQTIRDKARELEQKQARKFLDRLADAETAVKAVVAQLQANPSHAGVTAARASLRSLERLAPKADKDEAPPPPPPPDTLGEGDRVRVRKLGGREGEVLSLDGDRAEVRVGTLTSRVKVRDLERIGGPAPDPVKPKLDLPPQPPKARVSLDDAVRHPGNTCDLRGKRVDEGLAEVERFLDRASMRHIDTVFILHGHGTGAMKKAVRDWLRTSPYVDAHAPAQADQGGDAYTVAALR